MSSDATPGVYHGDPLLGARVGGYVVQNRIGHGGMGSVYLAEHPGIGRRAAVKVLHEQFRAQPEFVKRFFAEARSVNRIHSENIVEILDLSTLADGRYYILMEYLEGETLKNLLRRVGPLTIEQAASVGLQVLTGLAATHAQEIVHRDMKPANIYLTKRRDGSLLVKLLDFGVAKLSEPGEKGSTSTGSVLGTPSYMSPEQAAGRSHEVDPRSDLYSVGVVLYALLTGRTPFRAAGVAEHYHQQMSGPPPAATTIRATLTPDVDGFFVRALAVRPEDRFQSADEMSTALEALVPGDTQPARIGTVDIPIQAVLVESAGPPSTGSEDSASVDITFNPTTTADRSSPGSLTQSAAEMRPVHGAGGGAGGLRFALLAAAGLAIAAVAAIMVFGIPGGVGDGADPDQSAAAPVADESPVDDDVAPDEPATAAVGGSVLIEITTEPDGAMVTAKTGERVFDPVRAPATLELPRGETVVLEAELDGRRSETLVRSFADAEKVVLAFAPAPVPAGTKPKGKGKVKGKGKTKAPTKAAKAKPDRDAPLDF